MCVLQFICRLIYCGVLVGGMFIWEIIYERELMI